MRLTLGRTKELLVKKAPEDLLEYRINRVNERVITSGLWDGILQPIQLIARWGIVALPPQYRTIRGGKVGGYVRDTTTRYWDFLPGRSDAYGEVIQNFRDMGDNWPTLYPLPLGGRGYTSPPTVAISGDGTGATANAEVKNGVVTGVRIVNQGSVYTNATIAFMTNAGPPPMPQFGAGANALVGVENGLVATITMIVGGTLTLSYPGGENLSMIIYGTDSNYMPLTLQITGNTTVANPFVHIDRIHKEKGDVVLTLQHTSISGDITPLAIMAPSTQETFYRRYIIDALSFQPVEIISALCLLRHIEMEDDQDIIPIGNLSAIELGLTALQYESEGDMTLAGQYWQRCIDVLNDELKSMKNPDEIGTLRMRYPGRAVPKFVSTM